MFCIFGLDNCYLPAHVDIMISIFRFDFEIMIIGLRVVSCTWQTKDNLLSGQGSRKGRLPGQLPSKFGWGPQIVKTKGSNSPWKC